MVNPSGARSYTLPRAGLGARGSAKKKTSAPLARREPRSDASTRCIASGASIQWSASWNTRTKLAGRAPPTVSQRSRRPPSTPWRRARQLVHAIGWLRLRSEPARWSALVAPLRKANPKLPKYSDTLARLADDRVPVGKDEYSLDFAAQRRERTAVRKCVEVYPRPWWVRVEHVYVLGAEWLLECDVASGLREPKWYQQRFVAEMGVLRAPGTLRAIGALLPSRSAGALAARWIDDHREWILEDALPFLEKRGRDADIARAVRASLGGATAPPQADEGARWIDLMIRAVR